LTPRSRTCLQDKGLRVDWDDTTGNIVSTVLEYRPLGISDDTDWAKRSKVAPFICRGHTSNSYAKTLGVQTGWRVTAIGGVDCSGSRNFSEVKDLLNKSLMCFPPWPLRLDFLVNDSETKTFMLSKKPLGVEWSNTTSVYVKTVAAGSYAAHLGIKGKDIDREDWIIKRIGDVDIVPDDHTYEQQMELLDDGLAPLDHWESGSRVEDCVRGYDGMDLGSGTAIGDAGM